MPPRSIIGLDRDGGLRDPRAAWFLATAAGGALGYERGREKTYAGV